MNKILGRNARGTNRSQRRKHKTISEIKNKL